jgi:predicted aldo/keto reductase-like oxidoreductase
MQYRVFEKSEFHLPTPHYDAMRLLTMGDTIDKAEATRLIHDAIERSMSDLDAGYPFPEGIVGILPPGRAFR